MSVEKFLVRSFFGQDNAPPSIHIALAFGDSEISDEGYQRAGVTKGSWRITAATARTSVTFGPFARSVKFDRVWLMSGPELIDSIPMEDVVSQPRGTRWEQDVVVSLDG